jgi:hypothetical protein
MNDPQEEARQEWLGIELSERTKMAKALGITLEEAESAIYLLSESGRRGAVAGKRMRKILLAISRVGLKPTESLIQLGIELTEEE